MDPQAREVGDREGWAPGSDQGDIRREVHRGQHDPTKGAELMTESTVLERRLAVLKAEIEFDFPGLVLALEKGLKVAVVTESYLELELHPEVLRRVGGMVMLCQHFGAAVIFASQQSLQELNGKPSDR